MGDEFRVAPLTLLNEERVVVGNGLVERQGRLDAILVEHGEDPKNPDAVTILVVAIAADVGKGLLVPGPQALGAAHRAHWQRRIGGRFPIPVFEVDDHGEGDARVVRPYENGTGDNGGP